MPGFYPARRRFDSFRSHLTVRGVEAACRTLTPCGAGSTPAGPTLFFGIVQLAGHETLNLVIQVRALVPKPRRDTCVRRGTCVSRSLTMQTQDAGAWPSSATGVLRRGGGGSKTV